MDKAGETASVDFVDTEQFSEAVRPWQVTLDRLFVEPWSARFEFVRTNSLVIYREQWKGRVHVTGATPDGFVMIAAPTSSDSNVVWNGSTLRNGALICRRPSSEVNFFTADRSDHLVMLVRPGLLQRHLGEEKTSAMLRMRNRWAAGGSLCNEVVRTIDRMITSGLTGDMSLDDPAAFVSIEHELLTLLEQGIELDPGRPGWRRKPKRIAAMLRAIEFAKSIDHPIPVPNLCAAIDVNQRTLEHAFKESLGITPTKFLRLIRINKLHRRLSVADPGTTTITELASAHGFSELGRFAVEYRRLFGERPSETLGRRPTRPPVSLAD